MRKELRALTGFAGEAPEDLQALKLGRELDTILRWVKSQFDLKTCVSRLVRLTPSIS